jgi:hypothetical protein
MSRQFIDDREFDAIAAHLFDARQAHMLAIAQFVELPSLRAKDAPKVMRRLAFHNGAPSCKLFDEKTPAHAEILSQKKRAAVLCGRSLRNLRCSGQGSASDDNFVVNFDGDINTRKKAVQEIKTAKLCQNNERR